MIRKIYIGLFLIALFFVGCSPEQTKTRIPSLRVTVMAVDSQSVVLTHTYVAKIEESHSIPLSVKAAGQVTEVCCHISDHVKEGQLLLRLDNTQATHAYHAAQATFNEAKDGYFRAKQVYDEGGISQQKMVEIESKLTQAQSMYESSKKALQDCDLRSPRAGVIGRCDVQAGQVLAPGMVSILLLDVRGFNAVFAVPETEIASISIGDVAEVDVAAIDEVGISAHVLEKNMVANAVTHTYEVKASLDSSNAQLLPGMVAKVRLTSQQQKGVVLPADCISLLPSGTTVWVAHKRVAKRRSVTTGTFTQGGVLIVDGLQVGDTIITNGFQKLYNGAAITY